MMPTERDITGLDWNGPGVMGNDTYRHSTVDGRVVIYAYVWRKVKQADGQTRDFHEWNVWINMGADAAAFTPDEVDEIGASTQQPDGEYPPCSPHGYENGREYDITYGGTYGTFAEACDAARVTLADEQRSAA
jgi:hypothetical protein